MHTKLQFFTDISHEIRTPLTLILSPLSNLISKNNDLSLTQTYNQIYKNGIRLLQLVNQVMDISAIEFGKKTLFVQETNITIFIRDLKDAFNDLAKEKGLTYNFDSDPETIIGYIDADIVSKVLFNLISNAFKYTSDGHVSISLTIDQKQKLVISVSDSGIGIPDEQREFIFERFYMFNTSVPEQRNSSGIGLHLTSRLVLLHHGVIELDSEEGKGSCFKVIVPILKEDYPKEGLNENKNLYSKLESFLQDQTKHRSTNNAPNRTKHKHTLLIVEDNPEIRNVLNTALSHSYNILEASNGQEGLRLAIEKTPSLIISDLVMPLMDGMELCQKIRNNQQTIDIPFILLTARTSEEQQIEWLKYGADVYISKPFNVPFLQAKIKRLIQSREDKSKSIENKILAPAQNAATHESYDAKMLKKLNGIIEKHLDDSRLGVEFLSKEIGLSRSHLNRKMKDLTGESPASYIRQMRLHKSALLLKENNLTVAQIAFTVGFSSPSYFSQAFRDYYGFTPKEYINLDDLLTSREE